MSAETSPTHPPILVSLDIPAILVCYRLVCYRVLCYCVLCYRLLCYVAFVIVVLV